MTDLSIVIVSWNVRELLRRCLQSIGHPRIDLAKRARAGADGSLSPRDPTGTGLTCQIVVVDNGSNDGSTDMIRRLFPEVELLVNKINRGFPAANNQGLAIADGRYVLLLNPDTEIVGHALVKLVAFADEHPDVGVVGPQLLNPDGSVQSSRRRFPTLATAFLESTWLQSTIRELRSRSVAGWLTAPLHRVITRYYVADRPDNVIQDVDWVTGAAMLARRKAIREVGVMDEGYFMYSEELDWCRRFREAGWRVVYLPAAQIVHHVGKSSEQDVTARHIHFQTSKVRYMRKFHGPLTAELLRWYILGGYACQLGIEGGKWLVGHKRPLRAQRIAAYRDVLASKLRPGPQL